MQYEPEEIIGCGAIYSFNLDTVPIRAQLGALQEGLRFFVVFFLTFTTFNFQCFRLSFTDLHLMVWSQKSGSMQVHGPYFGNFFCVRQPITRLALGNALERRVKEVD